MKFKRSFLESTVEESSLPVSPDIAAPFSAGLAAGLDPDSTVGKEQPTIDGPQRISPACVPAGCTACARFADIRFGREMRSWYRPMDRWFTICPACVVIVAIPKRRQVVRRHRLSLWAWLRPGRCLPMFHWCDSKTITGCWRRPARVSAALPAGYAATAFVRWITWSSAPAILSIPAAGSRYTGISSDRCIVMTNGRQGKSRYCLAF